MQHPQMQLQTLQVLMKLQQQVQDIRVEEIL
jgi:hypothetical protein